MITGFNTDIVYQGVTYHVQTEDKGVDTPLILSLVYDRGTILASKRSPYNDLLEKDFSETELAERLQKQHKLICAAVRSGRLEDLKAMTLKEAAAKRKIAAQKKVEPLSETREARSSTREVKPSPVIAPPPIIQEEETAKPPQVAERAPTAEKSQIVEKPSVIEKSQVAEKAPVIEKTQAVEKTSETVSHEAIPPAPQLLKTPPIPPPVENTNHAERAGTVNNFSMDLGAIPKPAENEIWEIPISVLEDLIVDDVEIVEDYMILPDEAVAVVAEEPKNEPVDESLQIELLNEVSFKSGERKTLSVLVKRGSSENGLTGAHVMVKILGTSFRPQVFHAKTDSNGVAIVQLQLPRFTRGRAAVLVRAMSGSEETELRRVISQD